MNPPSLFDIPVPEGYRIGEPKVSVGDGAATGEFVVEWNGTCACGKSARDGIRCKLGATHAIRD